VQIHTSDVAKFLLNSVKVCETEGPGMSLNCFLEMKMGLFTFTAEPNLQTHFSIFSKIAVWFLCPTIQPQGSPTLQTYGTFIRKKNPSSTYLIQTQTRFSCVSCLQNILLWSYYKYVKVCLVIWKMNTKNIPNKSIL
jgi:hypothetical protein